MRVAPKWYKILTNQWPLKIMYNTDVKTMDKL